MGRLLASRLRTSSSYKHRSNRTEAVSCSGGACRIRPSGRCDACMMNSSRSAVVPKLGANGPSHSSPIPSLNSGGQSQLGNSLAHYRKVKLRSPRRGSKPVRPLNSRLLGLKTLVGRDENIYVMYYVRGTYRISMNPSASAFVVSRAHEGTTRRA